MNNIYEPPPWMGLTCGHHQSFVFQTQVSQVNDYSALLAIVIYSLQPKFKHMANLSHGIISTHNTR